ncbi:MAG: gluconokinase, partial [Bacteroidetes bacterium]|nr:gluconokinase [Bacteroidota bacterium]
MNYYLGIDIGTTSVKAVAFSETGAVISSHSIGYGMQHPQPGWSEQDPEEIAAAVANAINTVVQLLRPAKPVLLSFSAAMHSLIAVDKNGRPLTPCIIWADNRAAAIAEGLRNTDTGNRFYQATGVPIHAMSPLCKLLWLKAHEPEIFNSAFKFAGIKEYLFYHWFGEWKVDRSVASATGLLHLAGGQWDKTILDFLPIASEKLSQPVPVEQVFYYTPAAGHSLALQLEPGTPFVIGSSDGALSNIATCPAESRAMVVTIGTSAAARILTGSIQTDGLMRTFCYHASENQYIVGGAGNNGAVTLQWLKESILQTNDSFPQIFEQATQVPAGCDGLIFLPYLMGERAPLWNAHAKGVFFGLGIRHGKAHLIRAVMEGVIYAVCSIGRVLMENNDPDVIYANGGFAQSPLWLQMLADVSGKKVLVSDAVESSALGSVIVGAN